MSIFSLSGKGLRLDSKEEAFKALEELRRMSNVREIHLCGNTFSIAACHVVSELLSLHSKTLEVADFSDIFTGRTAQEIPEALEVLLSGLLLCRKCHTVCLSDNAFGPTAASPLTSFLSQHTPLQHLYLNNNGLGPNAGTCVAESLVVLAEKQSSNGYEKHGKLETVVCGRNRLESGSMNAWAACFRMHTSLKCLRMPQNGIRPDGIRILLESGLSACTQLQIFDLQDNTLTLVGAKTLAKVLPNWKFILELGVSDCLLSGIGVATIAKVLSHGHHKHLKILRLQYNEIDHKAVKILVDAVDKALPNLEILELNGNAFSDENDSIQRIRDIFKERKKGELDELDDMDEPSESNNSEDSDQESSQNLENTENEIDTDITILLEKTHIDRKINQT
ncbi:hypothetical protein PORY_001735 [Pneumocystis oryctolagi]|uniref:Uncharacterized protein n=1 Tax=Pneumocystis oryctolagi TaxID=42067 RepID=A0ACB7CC52_9ASCO|nr:hypothetical protein PORY_001735 [Pneumocystis oryctolagi]